MQNAQVMQYVELKNQTKKDKMTTKTWNYRK